MEWQNYAPQDNWYRESLDPRTASLQGKVWVMDSEEVIDRAVAFFTEYIANFAFLIGTEYDLVLVPSDDSSHLTMLWTEGLGEDVLHLVGDIIARSFGGKLCIDEEVERSIVRDAIEAWVQDFLDEQRSHLN